MATLSISCSSAALSTFKGNSVGGSLKASFAKGRAISKGTSLYSGVKKTCVGAQAQASAAVVEKQTTERFHLGNLGPQPGSRKRAKRKGRGIAAGQGASCGFGMRGQKSRSGPGVRPGFEGGQMPLYRRLPKLKGISGGMGAGLPKYVTVNLSDVAAAEFSDGEEVSLETLKSRGLINPSGRERKLPLKVLGEGELGTKLLFKAGSFSSSAREKLEALGCTLVTLPGRKKWVKPSVAKREARTAEFYARKQAEYAAPSA